MNEIDTLPREKIASRIQDLRNSGDLSGAARLCEDATTRFSDDYFYPKIAGDLYFQQEDYEAASQSYIEFLKRIPRNRTGLFSQFAKRYYRLRRVWSQERISQYAASIMAEIQQGHFDETISSRCIDLIKPSLPEEVKISAGGQQLIKSLSDGVHFDKLVVMARELETNNPIELEFLLDQYILNRERTLQTIRFDAHCVSIYERWKEYASALKIAEELLAVRVQAEIVRSIFRICRKIKDYRRADNILAAYPKILKMRDFNIFYELVYYFETQDNIDQVREILDRMEKAYTTNLPIQKTARNLYIRFGLLEDATRVENYISELYASGRKTSRKFADEVQESEVGIWYRIRELSSQLEHQKQLTAINELTTGISHELGQPITNIRYTVQFYSKLFKKKLERETVLRVFDSILEETERMGGLVKRLSPLTSSKSAIETFDLTSRIRKRVNAEDTRLQKGRISVNILPKTPIYLVGDPVKFDQLVSNLLLNAIDAINDRKKPGPNRIDIQVEDRESEVAIFFADTGVGISAKDRSKLFTPFFSTKAPGKGEGLGLFIVWNLLKMQGGEIHLDPGHRNGACFLITIPKTTQPEKEAG